MAYCYTTIFDIGGNNFRLIAIVIYMQNALRITHILTHDEYNRNKWRKI
ncbi:MAG: type II toxin-antitoxin system HigB family toxin [Elusimicrobiota bacterium]